MSLDLGAEKKYISHIRPLSTILILEKFNRLNLRKFFISYSKSKIILKLGVSLVEDINSLFKEVTPSYGL